MPSYFRKYYTLLFIFSISIAHAQLDHYKTLIPYYGLIADYELIDLDNDGINELIFSGQNGNNISYVKIQNGNYSKPVTLVSELSFPREIEVVDFDFSKSDDFIFSDNNGTYLYLTKNKAPNFEIHKLEKGGAIFKAHDFNQDRTPDLIYSTSTSIEISYYNQNFEVDSTVILTDSTGNLYTIALSDLNNDGNIDILGTSRYSHKLIWFKGNSDGSFSSEIRISQNITDPNYTATADFNNDGYLDIILSSDLSGKVQLYLNDQNDGFTLDQELNQSTQTPCNGIIIKDIDGDNDLDGLFIHSSIEHELMINNNGILTFHPQPATVGYYQAKELDINGDQIKEVVISSSDFLRKAVFHDSAFTVEDILPQDVGKTQIDFLHLNDDVFLDMISYSAPFKTLGYYTNRRNGYGSFTKIKDSVDISILRAYDLNANGITDILYVSDDSALCYIVNNLSFQLSPLCLPKFNGKITDLNFENLTDDDIKDLIITVDDGIKRTLHFNKGPFINPINMDMLVTAPFHDITYDYEEISTFDFDTIGDADILIATNKIITLMANAGNGNFQTSTLYSNISPSMKNISFGDYNKDGKTDFCYIDTYTNKLHVATNNGAGFNSAATQFTFSSNTSTASTDYDGDGDIDIIINQTYELVILENRNGLFATRLNTNHGILPGLELKLIDSNADGKDEVVFPNSTNSKARYSIGFNGYSRHRIAGTTFIDKNFNKILDGGDVRLPNVVLTVNPGQMMAISDDSGRFEMPIAIGDYELTYSTSPTYSLYTDSTSYKIKVKSTDQLIDSLDFGFEYAFDIEDLQSDLTSGIFRCGRNTSFKVRFFPNEIYQHISKIKLDLKLPPNLTLKEGAYPITTANDTSSWEVEINQSTQNQLWFHMDVPGFEAMNQIDTITVVLTFYGMDGNIMGKDTNSIANRIVCAYDPNDKHSNQEDLSGMNYIENGAEIIYHLRFQNTGNDTAFNVIVKDPIDSNLIPSTFRLIDKSHDVKIDINSEGSIAFNFINIHLPDSHVNEPASNGFVTFALTVKKNLEPSTQIFNTGYIYFDFNPAVITNTCVNTIECWKAPSIPLLNFNSEDSILIANQTSQHHQWYFNQAKLVEETNDTIVVSKNNGEYLFEAMDRNYCTTQSAPFLSVHTVKTDGLNLNLLNIYPNPTESTINIEGQANSKPITSISVTNILGALIREEKVNYTNNFRHSISFENEKKGIYFIKLTDADKKSITFKVVKK